MRVFILPLDKLQAQQRSPFTPSLIPEFCHISKTDFLTVHPLGSYMFHHYSLPPPHSYKVARQVLPVRERSQRKHVQFQIVCATNRIQMALADTLRNI